jgi:hypothetical protein
MFPAEALSEGGDNLNRSNPGFTDIFYHQPEQGQTDHRHFLTHEPDTDHQHF